MQQPGKFNDDEIKARWQKAQGRINVRSASVLFILQCIFMQEPFFNCGFHFWLLILFYAIKRVVLGPSRSAQAVTAQSCCFEISVDHYGVSTKVNQNCRSPPRFTDGRSEFPCTERITAASQLPLARWPESCAGASGSAAALPRSSCSRTDCPQGLGVLRPSPASCSSRSCQHSLSPRPFPCGRLEPCAAEEERAAGRRKTGCWDSSSPPPDVFSGVLGVGRGAWEQPGGSGQEGRKQRCSCRQRAPSWSSAARHGCTAHSLGTRRELVRLRAAGLSLPSAPPSRRSAATAPVARALPAAGARK